MSGKARINVVDPRSGFEMSIYLRMEGRRAKEMVARALERSLQFKPGDPESVIVFILGELTNNLETDGIYLTPGKMDDCDVSITVNTERQVVCYRSIYDGDPDRKELSYELFYAEMEGRLASQTIAHC